MGLQLSWRLRALIATGEWAGGERLPSLRGLAESAGVNVNTVRAVYEGLREQGLIAIHQGQGTFVAAIVSSQDASCAFSARSPSNPSALP